MDSDEDTEPDQEDVSWQTFLKSGAEFYNLREIYDNETIFPSINMSKTIIDHLNNIGI